jgi:hypothetical protein
MSYYSRYLAGEHEQVWGELVQCGSAVRTEPLYSDAHGVAKVLAENAYRNLALIHRRLVDFGYEFEEPKSALLEATTQDIQLLDGVEQALGTLPLVVRAWYERIASVNFCQAPDQLFSNGENKNNEAVAGLGLNTVLVYFSIPNSLALRQWLIDDGRLNDEDGPSDHSTNFFPTGGWASNCDPKGFQLPASGFDGSLFNDGGGDQYLVPELRYAFSWGGFPFWRIVIERKRFASPLRRNPEFRQLMPILREGMLPL